MSNDDIFQKIKTEAERTLRILHGGSDCFEVRILKFKESPTFTPTYAGYYSADRIDEAALEVAKERAKAPNTYVTLNPLDPDFLARAKHLTKANGTATDEYVTHRRWLLIDLDPERLGGVSSTNEEKKAAHKVAVEVRDWLRDEYCFRDPVCADSGNGYHLLYPIDLPNDDESLDLISKVLYAVATEYTDDDVVVDTKVGNASRITKLYGTIARKGESTKDRPHRRSTLAKVPEDLENGWTADAAVSREQLEAVAELHADTFNATSCGAGKSNPGERYLGGGEPKERRCWAYIAKMPESVSGHGGDNALFAVACRMVGFDLDDQQGMRMLRRWNNEFAKPAWTEYDLAKKWRSACKRADRGAMLLDSEEGVDPDVIAAIVVPDATIKKFGKRDEKVFRSLLNEVITAQTSELRRKSQIDLLVWAVGQGIEPDFLWSKAEEKFGVESREQYDELLGTARNEWQWREYESISAGYSEAAVTSHGFKDGSPQAYAAEYLESVKLHCSDHTWYYWAGNTYELAGDKTAQLESVTRWYIGTHPKGVAKRSDMSDILNAARSLATKCEGKGACYWIGKPEVDWDLKECYVTPTQLVNTETGESRPTSSALFCATPIGIEYDPEATECPNWDRVLAASWQDDPQARNAVQEWFGYCLTPDTSLHKILLLIGPPRSGKGTFARTVKAVLGKANVTGMDAGTFTHPHGKQGLPGKSLAVSGDARFSKRDAPVVVESLLSISGEDEQTINPKFGSPYSTRLPTRMMFLSNELPSLPDAGGALARRFIIVRQTKSFVGNEDKDLEKKLKEELPSILNWAMEGRRRLTARGKFVEPESSASFREALGDAISPVAAFVEKYCVVEPSAFVIKRELYQRYRAHIYNLGFEHILTETSFVRQLLSVAPSIVTKDRKLTTEQRDKLNAEIEKENKGKHRNHWTPLINGRPNINVGIRLKTDEELAAEDIETIEDEIDDYAEKQQEIIDSLLWNLDDPLETLRQFEIEGRDTSLLMNNMAKAGVHLF